MMTLRRMLSEYLVYALAGAVSEYIVPKSGKKMMRFVTGICIVFCIAGPLMSIDTEKIFSSFDALAYGEEGECSASYAGQAFENAVIKDVSEKLINAGFSEYEIKADVITENNDVVLKKVLCLIGKKYEGRMSELSVVLSDYKDVLETGIKENE